ncbi:MAG: Ribosomal large subunit pseudouridine synthase D [Phycisphaerae bacterium]|nr:Ribosomal large subunit pseudouridine synthase D [Phycisphaerae bacterium]
MDQPPLTVAQWLRSQFPDAKMNTLRQMVQDKRVLLNGQAVRSLKQAVGPGDQIALGSAAHQVRNLDEGLRILYQDADLIVVDKPPGLLSSTHAQEKRPTAVAILQAYVRTRHKHAAILRIHRLDKDASGLLVFARTPEAYDALKGQFHEHTITRQYIVVVHGRFDHAAGRLENLLVEGHRGYVRTTDDPAKGRPARLDYEVLRQSADRALLRCTLHTGRKHQIRVQFRAAGHAVCGDAFYGQADEPPGRLALHATHLAFDHPRTGQRMSFDNPPPRSFAEMFGK